MSTKRGPTLWRAVVLALCASGCSQLDTDGDLDAEGDAGEFRQGNFRTKFGAQKGKAGARRPGKSKRAARRGRQ